VTPEQYQGKWLSLECGCSFIRKCYHADMKQEIERLQAQLKAEDEEQEVYHQTVKRLTEELEQAKAYLGRLLLAHYPQIELLDNLLGVCTQIDNGLAVALREAKERERQLREEVDHHRNWIQTGDLNAHVETRVRHRMKDLESANARMHTGLTLAIKLLWDINTGTDPVFIAQIKKAEAALADPPAQEKGKTMNEYLTDPLALAVLFHHTYERLAPDSGYETRKETRIFDPESPNGKLMIRVCAEIQSALKENYPEADPPAKEKP